MMVQGQLGQPQPTAFVPMLVTIEQLSAGLLGNRAIQVPTKIVDPEILIKSYRQLFSSAQPTFKLALLKRQKFTPQQRDQRVRASLAALNATQPIDLNLAQWKEIVEALDDEV